MASSETKPRKPRGRPFGKGKSGNPGGRPKGGAEVRELAKQYTDEALKRLAYWMRSAEPAASVKACQTLLDRGHGKATQAVELTGKEGEPLRWDVTIAKG